MEVTDDELHPLYLWDRLTESRVCLAVLVAEVVHHFVPRLVELHNYSGAHGLTQKLYNWDTLNQKVFRRLGFLISKAEIEATANCEAGAIERILKLLRTKLEDKSSSNQSFEEGGTGDDEVMSLRQQFAAASVFGRPIQANGRAERQNGAPPSPLPRNPAAGAQVSFTASNPNSPNKGMKGSEARPAESRAGPRLSNSRSMGSQNGSPGPRDIMSSRSRMPRTPSVRSSRQADDVLAAREDDIRELQEVTKLMEDKVEKLEQLVRLKDVKIQSLIQKLQHAGLA